MKIFSVIFTILVLIPLILLTGFIFLFTVPRAFPDATSNSIVFGLPLADIVIAILFHRFAKTVPNWTKLVTKILFVGATMALLFILAMGFLLPTGPSPV